MKLHPTITNRAPRNGYICDAATDLKAKEECKDYDFFVISPGFYLCQNAENAYVIEETAKTVGCACAAMTFNKHPGEVCKHIVAMGFLDEVPVTPLTVELKRLFRFEGWIGENMLIPPASYQKKPQQKKEEKPKEATRQETRDSSEKWKGMSPAQMCQSMDDKELAKNARKGGVAAIAEMERRKAVCPECRAEGK